MTNEVLLCAGGSAFCKIETIATNLKYVDTGVRELPRINQ